MTTVFVHTSKFVLSASVLVLHASILIPQNLSSRPEFLSYSYHKLSHRHESTIPWEKAVSEKAPLGKGLAVAQGRGGGDTSAFKRDGSTYSCVIQATPEYHQALQRLCYSGRKLHPQPHQADCMVPLLRVGWVQIWLAIKYRFGHTPNHFIQQFEFLCKLLCDIVHTLKRLTTVNSKLKEKSNQTKELPR